jgi:hypothetical protein
VLLKIINMTKEINNQRIITTVLIVTVFTAIGFFGGMQYQMSKLGKMRGQFPGQMRNGTGDGQNNFGNQNRGRMGGGMNLGEIISTTDKSITIKLSDGSTKIILVSDNTNINKSALATISDLKIGEKVSVFGTPSSDGTLTATNVQLNPVVRNESTITPEPKK